MYPIIRITDHERKELLEIYRHSEDSALRLRAHIILLLADGYSWSMITAVLYCSSRTIAHGKHCFARGGVPALCGETRGRPLRFSGWWIAVVARWVLEKTPRDFGLLRSRWCCATLVAVLLHVHHVQVSRETVRQWLHREQLVWRRPRPVVGPTDPAYAAKIRRLRQLLATLPEDEVAVFEDEVDINTNPKIGAMWMRKGTQAEVVTPGNNEKRYLAGSLNWRTGQLLVTEGPHRNSELFVAHLEHLRHRLRRYRKIHVICDSPKFHQSKRVEEYVRFWKDRLELHWLPKYSPQANPIERVWWHLHEDITRNHRCRNMEELLDMTFAWLEYRTPFDVEQGVYTAKYPQSQAI